MDDARRQQLLDRLESIITSEGFSDLRVGALAERLGCSRTTLYKLAPGKDELVLLVCDRYADRAQAEAVAATSEPGLTQGERIRTWAEVIHEWQGLSSRRFWRDVAAWQPALDLFRRQSDYGILWITLFIENGVASGEFRPVNARYVAEVISRASRATRDPRVLEATGLTSGQAMAELAAYMVDGLNARP